MAKLSKRAQAIKAKVDRTKVYAFDNAVALIKELATAKFNESIDVSVQLGVDPKKSDQVVRGSVVLPAGTGKTVRVAVFATGDKAEQAKAAGADVVGMEDLAERVKAGDMPFDIVIASPDTMRIVGTLGQILGPRGLMPNPKVGTVTPDVATAVKNAKAGQVQYRTDKAGIIHATIGRKSFADADLKTNLVALIDALNKAKPASSKGVLPAQSIPVVHHGRWRTRGPRWSVRQRTGAQVRTRAACSTLTPLVKVLSPIRKGGRIFGLAGATRPRLQRPLGPEHQVGSGLISPRAPQRRW